MNKRIRPRTLQRSATFRLQENARGPRHAPKVTAWEGRGTLRAAIFGINDGLVSNPVMGIVSASTDSRFVLLAGYWVAGERSRARVSMSR